MLLLSLELLLTSLLRFLLYSLLSLLRFLNLLLLLLRENLSSSSGGLLNAFAGAGLQTPLLLLLPAKFSPSFGKVGFAFASGFGNSRRWAGFRIGSFNACFLNSGSGGLGRCGRAAGSASPRG